jgi:cytidine deaminase
MTPPTPRQTTTSLTALISAATATITNTPPSATPKNATVAAAALSSSGAIFTGVNIHHFAGGACAETVALSNASAAGEAEKLTHIVAVLNRGRGVIPPCGRCRQMLLDLCPGINVVMADVKGEVGEDGGQKVMIMPVGELLPGAYRIVDYAGGGGDGVISG